VGVGGLGGGGGGGGGGVGAGAGGIRRCHVTESEMNYYGLKSVQ